MTKFFTHYWQNHTWVNNVDDVPEGELLEHTAGNLFKSRGVEIGDVVYIVTVKKGNLFLGGCLTVGKICNVKQAARELKTTPAKLWIADEHVIASEATTIQKNLRVSLETTKKIRFVSSNNSTLKFTAPGNLDKQTLRGVRQLTEASANLFDECLDNAGVESRKTNFKSSPAVNKAETLWNDEIGERTGLVSFVEGAKTQKFVTVYERDPRLKKMAIEIHGYNCLGCGFNFENFYGEHGKDFIHVHHLKPISEFGGQETVNPETDLTVLCPNCHAMVHRSKNKTLSLEELQNLVNGRTFK